MDKAVKKDKEIIAKFETCISKGKNMKESRHAYMIMAHNDFDMLYEILRELDYRRNDIFLHIDRKSQNVPIEHLCSAVKEANLVIIPRKNVNSAASVLAVPISIAPIIVIPDLEVPGINAST